MQLKGSEFESIAASYLQAKHGWHLLARNVWFREGELDLVMKSPEGLVFVEVKGRNGDKFGPVVEALTHKKWTKWKKAICRYWETSGDRRSGRMLFVGVSVVGARVVVEEFWVE